MADSTNEVNQLLEGTTESMERTKAVLRDLANELASLVEIVGPQLDKQIFALRQARMTVTTEIREILTPLRDIRKFFLEDDYDREMIRLERFVVVCKELKELKAAGVLDAVSDTIIRLSIAEKK